MARHELAPAPTAAVVFLHGSGDTGAGAQAWAAHVWEGPHGDFETTLGVTANAKVNSHTRVGKCATINQFQKVPQRVGTSPNETSLPTTTPHDDSGTAPTSAMSPL